MSASWVGRRLVPGLLRSAAMRSFAAACLALWLALLCLPGAGHAGQRFVPQRDGASQTPRGKLPPGRQQVGVVGLLGRKQGGGRTDAVLHASAPAIVSFADQATEDFFHG